MRGLEWLIAVVACSPGPAERLRDPQPSPGRCKSPAQVYEVQRPVFAHDEVQLAATRARFFADHPLTLEPAARLHPITSARHERDPDAWMERAIDAALRSQPDRDLIQIDLGRDSWSQVVIQRVDAAHEPCGKDPLPLAAFTLAHDASGHAVVIRTRTSRRVVSSIEQCGRCSYGCGIPQVGLQYTGVVLPLAAGVPVRVETLDLVEDRVQVWCEREDNAQ